MATEQRPSVRVGLASDRGHLRKTNEDACLAAPERCLFIVADGMGGRQAGAIAAQLTISTLPELVDRELDIAREVAIEATPKYGDALCSAVIALNTQLGRQGQSHPALRGMGATLVLALLVGRRAYIAHVGDSRAYLLRAGRLTRLTADHNLSELLVRLNKITPAEATTHPGRHRLTRYIGMTGDAAPDLQSLEVEPRDRFLLCTDGLNSMLDDTRISTLLESEPDPHAACALLLHAANAAGGRDNISVVLIDVISVPSGCQ